MTEQARIDKGLYWDRAWSLVEGCTLVSAGCANCWSATATHIRAGQSNPKMKARYEGLTDKQGRFVGEIRLMWQDLEKPLHVKKSITWSIWNDLFHYDVPFSFIDEVWEVMDACPQHTFMILTKRPERMLKYWAYRQECILHALCNVWLGVTGENQEQLDRRTVILCQIPAQVHFVSVEPMLERIDIEKHLMSCGGCGNQGSTGYVRHADNLCNLACIKGSEGPAIDWVVCGAESGPRRRPFDYDWARGIKDQCVEYGVPFFFKQAHVAGKPVKLPELDGRTWAQFPEFRA